MRHAKSDWNDGSLSDYHRPLAPRGLKDAPRMGEVLSLFDCVPDWILASPAQRARETAELVADACDFLGEIQCVDDFYGGGSADLIEALQTLPPEVDVALLVGHNPTMEETAAALLAESRPGLVSRCRLQMPTAALACIDQDATDWRAWEPGDGILRWFLIPKLVKALTS
jgi:phosphohistidine phosphatase